MLKSAGIIVIVFVAGASLAFGCGGGGGSTSDEASTLCEERCDVPDQIGECEDIYIRCIDVDDGVGEECEVLALEACGGL
jgi:hypothetical protein